MTAKIAMKHYIILNFLIIKEDLVKLSMILNILHSNSL